jgi:Phosphopantetheine attachment site
LLNDPSTLEIVTRELGIRLYSALLKPIEEMRFDQRLGELGVDSSALIEMRNWMKRSLGGAEVGTLDFVNAKTIEGIAREAVEAMKKKFLPKELAEDNGDEVKLTTRKSSLDKRDSADGSGTLTSVDVAEQSSSKQDSENGQVEEQAPRGTTEQGSEKSLPLRIPEVFLPKEGKLPQVSAKSSEVAPLGADLPEYLKMVWTHKLLSSRRLNR